MEVGIGGGARRAGGCPFNACGNECRKRKLTPYARQKTRNMQIFGEFIIIYLSRNENIKLLGIGIHFYTPFVERL